MPKENKIYLMGSLDLRAGMIAMAIQEIENQLFQSRLNYKD